MRVRINTKKKPDLIKTNLRFANGYKPFHEVFTKYLLNILSCTQIPGIEVFTSHNIHSIVIIAQSIICLFIVFNRSSVLA